MMDVVRLLPLAVLGAAGRKLSYEAICIPRSYNGIPIPVRRLARLARRSGVATHVWTINDPAVAVRLWGAGVQGIITDDPATMLRARQALSRGGSA